MKKFVVFLFVCLLNGMFFSCTPEEMEDSIALENTVAVETGDDGQTTGEEE